MSKSARITSVDFRALFEMIGECRDRGDDPSEWRRHYFARLAALTGADLVIGGELGGVKGGRPSDLGATEWGWEHGFDPRGWARALELLQTDPTYSPVFNEYSRYLSGADGVALRRTDMIEEPAWERSAECREVYRTAGVSHSVYCFRSISGAADALSGTVLLRAAGKRDYNPREKEIVREAQALIVPLIGGALARYAEPSPSDLSPRVREVLRCLLEGDGDKQIASRVEMSPHTVNVHTKAIYRHFGVRSRAELLARWVRRGWSSRCVWAEQNDGG